MKEMYRKITRALRSLYRGQSGMTGLEKSIILVAFVAVATILAYTVLSAGVLSAEKSTEAVHHGLQEARATMEVKGFVLGISANQTELETVEFTVGLTMPDEVVDMDAVAINYFDKDIHSESATWSYAISAQSTERGAANILEAGEQHICTVTIPGAAEVTAYDWFAIQVIPPTGASLTIKRTMPGTLEKIVSLQ
jgi:flagellin FlaB